MRIRTLAAILAMTLSFAFSSFAATADQLVMLFATPGGTVFVAGMSSAGTWGPPQPVEHFLYVDGGGATAVPTTRGRVNTSFAPAAAAAAGDYILAVRLENGRIATLRSSAGFSGPVMFPDVLTDRGPSIVGVGSGVLIAWVEGPGEVLRFAIRSALTPVPPRGSVTGPWRLSREG